MIILAAAGYLTLLRDFKLARMIKNYCSASCHQVVKIRDRYMCYMAYSNALANATRLLIG